MQTVAPYDGDHAGKGPAEDIEDDCHDQHADEPLVGAHQGEPLGDPSQHGVGAGGARNARADGESCP